MDKVVGVIFKSILVNTCLVVVKLILGFIGNSKALIANAIHSLSDLITDIISIFGYKLSLRPADKKHPLGFGQIEYLTNIIVSFVIFYLGIQTVITAFDSRVNIPSNLILVASVITAIVKYILSEYIYRKGRAYQNGILLVSGIESRADFLTSSLVVISVVFSKLSYYNSIFSYSDNIATIIIGLYVIYVAFKIMRENIINIIGSSPENEEMVKDIEIIISNEKEVKEVTELSVINYGSYYVTIIELNLKNNITLKKINKLKSSIKNNINKYNNKITYIKISVNLEVE